MSISKLWIHPKKRRYYHVAICQDLFGDWVLVKTWGSLDSKRGNIQTELLDSMQDGETRLVDITKRRLQRRYQAYENY